jgi:methylase of polypeptide subunit release factors
LEAGRGQAEEIIQVFGEAGWRLPPDHVCTCRDLVGINRVVAIKRHLAP